MVCQILNPLTFKRNNKIKKAKTTHGTFADDDFRYSYLTFNNIPELSLSTASLRHTSEGEEDLVWTKLSRSLFIVRGSIDSWCMAKTEHS